MLKEGALPTSNGLITKRCWLIMLLVTQKAMATYGIPCSNLVCLKISYLRVGCVIWKRASHSTEGIKIIGFHRYICKKYFVIWLTYIPYYQLIVWQSYGVLKNFINSIWAPCKTSLTNLIYIILIDFFLRWISIYYKSSTLSFVELNCI